MRSLALLVLMSAQTVLALIPVALAQECEDGRQTSASGKILQFYPDAFDSRAWYLIADVVIKSCDFVELWLPEGPPKECSYGAAFVANGTINTQGSDVTLDVDDILCIPQ